MVLVLINDAVLSNIPATSYISTSTLEEDQRSEAEGAWREIKLQ